MLKDAFERLFDPRFGVIGRVDEAPQEPGMPQFFHYYARGTDTAKLGGQAGFDRGGGASIDRERALSKAIGEVIERYCSALYDVADLPFVAANEAVFRHVDPADFALYREDQYAAGHIEFVPFTERLPVRWAAAFELGSERETCVPAAAVYLPYLYHIPDEQPIFQPISTGLACGENYTRALVSAACEAIERDAFTIFWQNKLAPPRIPTSSLDDENVEILRRFERSRFDVSLFDITTDVRVTSALAVARHDDPSQPALSVAAASHPVAGIAIRKSLEELEHTRFWSRRLKATTTPVDSARTENILEQEDHLRFWSERSNRHLADWLFESTAQSRISCSADDRDDAELLSSVRTAVEATGLRLLHADLTTPEIRELGLHVARAIVPGLHPLVIGHVRRALGGRRLREVPVRLGYAASNLALDDPSGPHPFP
jgi:ribosomal protein S12 methylthiotransferase accessory factor